MSIRHKQTATLTFNFEFTIEDISDAVLVRHARLCYRDPDDEFVQRKNLSRAEPQQELLLHALKDESLMRSCMLKEIYNLFRADWDDPRIDNAVSDLCAQHDPKWDRNEFASNLLAHRFPELSAASRTFFESIDPDDDVQQGTEIIHTAMSLTLTNSTLHLHNHQS